MCAVEFLLSAVLGFLFWKKSLHRRFPAMGAYLALRVAATPILFLLYRAVVGQFGGSPQFRHESGVAYFLLFWSSYIVSAAILLFVTLEVFRSALSGLPGLMKFGIVIFRWAILVSVIVSFSTVTFTHRGMQALPEVASGLMRSVSILELSLLAFLCLSMNALRLSVRDLAFGISLGFGLLASNDLVAALLAPQNHSLTGPAQFFYEGVVLAALGTWVAFASMPERVRQPIVMPVSSAIYRWNEIASALGHPGTQVAVQSANSFFLTDVEKVVDKVLNRTLKGRESES